MKVETYTCYIEQEKMVDIPVRKLIHTDDVGRIAESLGYTKFAEETIGMLCLNIDNEVTAYHEIARGTIQSVATHTINIIKRAVLCNCNLIVLFHNHPMASAEPSEADRKVHEEIKKACDLVGIILADSVVIAGDGRTDHKDFSKIARSTTMAIRELQEKEGGKA